MVRVRQTSGTNTSSLARREFLLSAHTSAERKEFLLTNLVIVPENIRNEAIDQVILYTEAIRYRVARMRRLSRAKAELKAYQSQAWLKARARALERCKESKERVTNDYIASLLQKDPELRRLEKAVDDAAAQEEFSKLLLDAFRMRRDAIKILADAEGYEASRQVAEVNGMEQNQRLSQEARKLYTHRGNRPE